MAQPIPHAAHSLLDEPNFAHVVTLMPDGGPQTTPVWLSRDGDAILVNTAKGRTKHRNLERDPRIALSVHDRANPYRWLQVRGLAELVDAGADAHIDALSRKYIGKGTYPFRQPGEERVIVRIVGDAVTYAEQ